MQYRTAKWIFILGTVSSLVLFLALTFDTHRQVHALTNADKLDAQVISGKKVFEKYNCNVCHTILGFGSYYAPDLTRVYWRRGEDGLRKVLQSPEKVFASSFRKMPQQHLTKSEISDLIVFFKWVSEIETHDWPPQDKNRKPGASETRRLIAGQGLSVGAALFKTKGCMGCHQINGVGGTSGPELDHVGSHRTAANIAAFIVNPAAENPDSAMPAQQLTEEEAQAIGKFLEGLK